MNHMQFTRITVNPDQMGGVPCIRGLRIPVVTVVEMVADGMTTEEILTAFPDLEYDDIREALKYAAVTVQGQKDLDETSLARELPLVTLL
jgi:uncharacterized protein (DUF433 family)